ncbi:NAD(P)-dependent oxidoreductase [Algoriphagus pacificus]|uniref:Saccharopine dehydrogenase [NAD(+), L-lysine-forming] n=1 Tax=Algoriphagus pacificus TaxID=2811234 RepID=A0ABS3CBK3_9BACT|nr:NAD(P)-dependent oxidoreductase [Algoriphagus pacificus]MBN7814493.1 alanine dehydrogenase [Algoriphagus pacificus]
MKIGIIREGKNPPDRRTPFTPRQLKQIQSEFADKISFQVQSSPHRCFTDQEYSDEGIEIVEELSACDIIFGVKEIPINQLLEGKTYFFFSHTMKKQPYNRALLQAILAKNIRLLDYEVLKDSNGKRVVAFGRWAGIVGAYNGFWTYGQKTDLFDIKRAYQCFDRKELESELKKVQLPPIKIVLTGSGRVGKGAMEIMHALGIKQVSTQEFLHQYFDDPVYVMLSSSDFNRRKSDGGFDKQEFYTNPELYESHFLKFAEEGEILISTHYWDPDAPKLFKLEEINNPDFMISVIADVSCDVHGSVPTTLKTTNILEPVFDVERETGEIIPAFGSQNSISVMAIDNLPCELPREASTDFGNQLIEWVIPELLKDYSPILEGATIAREGDLTVEFIYLTDFVNGD